MFREGQRPPAGGSEDLVVDVGLRPCVRSILCRYFVYAQHMLDIPDIYAISQGKWDGRKAIQGESSVFPLDCLNKGTVIKLLKPRVSIMVGIRIYIYMLSRYVGHRRGKQRVFDSLNLGLFPANGLSVVSTLRQVASYTRHM